MPIGRGDECALRTPRTIALPAALRAVFQPLSVVARKAERWDVSKDPILDELRAIRDEIARSYGYDVHAIVAGLQKSSQEAGRASISLPPKPTSEDDDRNGG